MRVIKLGGSLTNSPLLKDWLDAIGKDRKNEIVVVPGGGAFADQVRIAQKQWCFAEKFAHSMAILAMQQMALLFKGINPRLQLAGTADDIERLLSKQQTVIWSPDINWLELSEIPATWEITSDSLAAWIATRLHANELILVKSALIPEAFKVQQLREMGIVDEAFCAFIENVEYDIKFFNRNQISLLKQYIKLSVRN